MAATERRSEPLGRFGREEAILCLAARTCPDDRARASLRARLAANVDWPHLLDLGHRHEVIPVLADNVLREVATPPPAEWVAAVRRRTVATALQNERLLAVLTDVLAAFAEAGVEAVPVKGLVLSSTLYGSIARRPAGDLDVLVRPHDLSAARNVLSGLGFRHSDAPTFEERAHPFHDPVWFRTTPSGTIPLELHWGLWSSRFFGLDVEPLWEDLETIRLGDRDVRVLGPTSTLLHLAVHRTRSALRLRWVCDIAELVRARGHDLDWGRVLRLADEAGARTSIWVALSLAQDLLGAEPPAEIMRTTRPSALKRRVLDRTCGVPALFHASPPGDVRQQPHLIYRLVEQDGLGHIAASLGSSAIRTARKRLDRAGIVRV